MAPPLQTRRAGGPPDGAAAPVRANPPSYRGVQGAVDVVQRIRRGHHLVARSGPCGKMRGCSQQRVVHRQANRIW